MRLHRPAGQGSIRFARTLTVGVVALASGLALVAAPVPANAATSSQRPHHHGRVANPFVGVGYVNPQWKANAEREPGGSQVANNPTGVWLDRTTVTGRWGVRHHLDTALAQGADYIQFVIADLPGRNCATWTEPDGQGADETEIDAYKRTFIDRIAAIQSRPRYRHLRIVNIIEPGLLTDFGYSQYIRPSCDSYRVATNYRAGVAYALGRLSAPRNAYSYLDAGGFQVAGWESESGTFADLLAETAAASTGGLKSVSGFIVNVANYSSTTEPFLRIDMTVGGYPVTHSRWVDWNSFVDQAGFVQAFRQKLIDRGFAPTIGALIDTSRNGWGGAARPTGTSTAQRVDDYVNEVRIDRRISAQNWCNQAGAGLGERPKANPMPGIDAFVWAKPPGESDGASTPNPDESIMTTRMCDPAGNAWLGSDSRRTGALPDAPKRGEWFSAQFRELMRNAYPPL